VATTITSHKWVCPWAARNPPYGTTISLGMRMQALSATIVRKTMSRPLSRSRGRSHSWKKFIMAG